MLSAKSGKHLAVGIALAGAPSVFFGRSGYFCISRTSIGQYVEAAKQQVWAREARLAESDA